MTDKLNIANPSDRNFFDNLYRFIFGAYGSTIVYAWGSGVCSVLEDAAGWLKDNGQVGHLYDDENMAELYNDAKADNPDGTEEQWQEAAEADLTYTEAGYLTSYEWGVCDATDEEKRQAKDQASAYVLELTDDEVKALDFIGGRYGWANELSANLGDDNVVRFEDESDAWQWRDDCDEDAEGGHSLFPMASPEFASKLIDFYSEIV